MNISHSGDLEGAQVPTAKPDACLTKLCAAERFEGYEYGGVGQHHQNYNAFAVARCAGAAIGVQVKEMLQSATPAGRLYAALLLREIDETSGCSALRDLLDDDAVVEAVWDCSPDSYPVKQLAAEALEGRMMIDIKPPLRGFGSVERE